MLLPCPVPWLRWLRRCVGVGKCCVSFGGATHTQTDNVRTLGPEVDVEGTCSSACLLVRSVGKQAISAPPTNYQAVIPVYHVRYRVSRTPYASGHILRFLRLSITDVVVE